MIPEMECLIVLVCVLFRRRLIKRLLACIYISKHRRFINYKLIFILKNITSNITMVSRTISSVPEEDATHLFFASESVGEGHPDKLCD